MTHAVKFRGAIFVREWHWDAIADALEAFGLSADEVDDVEFAYGYITDDGCWSDVSQRGYIIDRKILEERYGTDNS